MPNSSRLAFDWMLAPASWRSLTTVASNGEVKPERTLEAAVVGLDAVTMLSLTAIDLPASEPEIVRQHHGRRERCRASLTGRGSNGIFDVVDGSVEPAGLLLCRAHIVLISLCAQEESVPRPV